ncbi:MAG TPA: hypothetical protein VIX12_06790, partial [Candidatus Binataceae bacterium]
KNRPACAHRAPPVQLTTRPALAPLKLPGRPKKMAQLRTASLIVAIIASVIAFISGSILFFVIEPPFLASIFLAAAAIAIICFSITGICAYWES